MGPDYHTYFITLSSAIHGILRACGCCGPVEKVPLCKVREAGGQTCESGLEDAVDDGFDLV